MHLRDADALRDLDGHGPDGGVNLADDTTGTFDDPEDATYIALANPTSILSMIARLEALEEALKPFAEVAGKLDADWTSSNRYRDDRFVRAKIQAGDFRRAGAALSKLEDK